MKVHVHETDAYRVSTAQGERERDPSKYSSQGQHREFRIYVVAKTREIMYAQIANILILKIKAIFAARFLYFSLELAIS